MKKQQKEGQEQRQRDQPGGYSQVENYGSWVVGIGNERVANSGNILRVKPAGLADKMHVICERKKQKRSQGYSKVFFLSN